MKESKFYQEIIEEGKLIKAREAVLDVLNVRFGSRAATEFGEALNDIMDEQQLTELHRLAILSPHLGDFRRSFGSFVAH